MMINGAAVQRGLPGRQVLQSAIEEYEARVAFSVSVIEAYGAENIGDRLRRSMSLDRGVVAILSVLLGRGAVRLEDLPKDKDGKPRFVDKLRWEVTQEIVQMVAGSLRGAFQTFPIENAVEQPKGAADAA